MKNEYCEDCGSAVYDLGCVNCNEEAYINQQAELDDVEEYNESREKW